jgi:hypothetical protein
MRLPAVAMAAAFAGGIAIGLLPGMRAHAASRELAAGFFILAGMALLAGAIFVARNFLRAAAGAALWCWVTLGIAGACLAQQPRAADHVISLVESGQLDLHTPLRWHGRLRDEPARLPWGYGYEVELAGVEYRGEFLPLCGDLRVSYSEEKDGDGRMIGAPVVGAGDEITVLTEARRPQVFRDEGAFDRRAFLAGQDTDLVATLRAAGLMERVVAARPGGGYMDCAGAEAAA